MVVVVYRVIFTPNTIPKTIPNSRNQGFFQNSKEKRGNECRDKIK
jgi:hypothetical protein